MPRSTLLFVAVVLAGCASAAPAPTTPAPPPEAPSTARPEPTAPATSDPAPSREPAADESPATAPEAAPAIRAAPDRWWHLATVDGNVPSAHIDEAYELLAGRAPQREVVVAVIDGGVDIEHEDLDDVLWTNPGEVAGNGIDDDGNGYADDVHGWNFIGGAEGSVEYDTYEATRLHAACIGAPAAGATPRPDDATCARAAEAYQAEKQEMTSIAAQITQLQQIYPVVLQILRTATGAEPTPERVAALQPTDARTTQARDLYLQLAGVGLNEETLAEQAEEVDVRVTYGLDTAFDPRPIVGDDYGDPTERAYGNGDVEGPDASHGTAVASVVAAERDNGLGIDGAGNGVRIMSVRTVPNGDERDKDVANAIRYAVDNGAHVINMSFGKDFSPWKSVVDDAVRYADEHGVLMVHASGNDGADLSEATNFPNPRYEDGGSASLWIEVGASGWQGADSLAASFSNYGATQVDVFAPGVAIEAAGPDNEYGPHDGTSLAAPVVSGIAGMLMAYFPDLTASDVRTIILETATDAGDLVVVRPGEPGRTARFGDLSVTGGVVNAAEAVRRAMR